MTTIILSGCNGTMGQVITKCAENSEYYEIAAGYDPMNDQSITYPVYKDVNDCKEKASAIIDFSHPTVLEDILNYAVSTKTPIVVATTGLLSEHKEKLKEASKEIPVFISANMSLGVNLLMNLVKQAARVLEDTFDIEIIEKHHNKKIDAPSGTALAIADAISEALTEDKEYVYDRHSVRKRRNKKEIGLHAVRGGTIVGDHSVVFAGTDEIIEINHHAASKEIFAMGALKAAKFISDKKPGMYSMEDVVSI